MSFIDMAYLTYDNLRGGHLTYYRRKTGGRLDIRWEQQMQTIIDKYPKDTLDIVCGSSQLGKHSQAEADSD